MNLIFQFLIDFYLTMNSILIFHKDKMSKHLLKNTLEEILKVMESTSICLNRIDKLIELICDEQANQLKNFISYLEDLKISPKDIAYITKILKQKPQVMAVSGTKMFYSWLEFRIYELMGIISQSYSEERSKIRKIFSEFRFHEQSLEKLIKYCIFAINKEIGDLQKIMDIILQDYDDQNRYQKQSYLKNQIVQYMNEMVENYNSSKEDSFDKLLQRQKIIAFVKQYPMGISILKNFFPEFKLRSRVQDLRKLYLERGGFISEEIQQCLSCCIQEQGTYQSLIDLNQKIKLYSIMEVMQKWKPNNLVQNIKKKSKNLLKNIASKSLKYIGLFDSTVFLDIYQNFNQNIVKKEMKMACLLEQSFHLQRTNQIIYVIRKHSIIYSNLSQVCDDILRKDINDETKVKLAQIIKYSIREGGSIEFNILINLIKKYNNDDNIKSEFFYALGFKIKDSKDIIQKNILEQVSLIINHSNKSDAKNFLYLQIQSRNNNKLKSISNEELKQTPIKFRKGPNVIVTKNQHKIKFGFENSQSQQTTINIFNLTEALKKRNKLIKMDANFEKLPPAPKKSGSDQSFWSGTYVNVKQLYFKAMNNETLKDKDKDQYLMSKFIDKSKWFTTTFLDLITGDTFFGDFITDRLICSIFHVISKQQQLHSKVIKKLFMFINQIEIVKINLLNLKNFKQIAQKIRRCESIIRQQYSNQPQIIKDFAQNIYKKCFSDVEETWIIGRYRWKFHEMPIFEIFTSEIQKMRAQAAQAIYNCAKRNKNILSNRFDQLKQCLKDKNTKFRGLIQKILVLDDNDQTTYKALFQSSLLDLQNNQNTEHALAYIKSQSNDSKRCKELFNEKIISKISKLLQNNNIEDEKKLLCCEIINNCLQYSYNQGLNNKELFICGELIEKTQNKKLKTEVLRSILLTANKNLNLPKQITNALIIIMRDLQQKDSNIIILILGKIHSSIQLQSVDQLSFKLLNDEVAVGKDSDIYFEQRSKENISLPSISSIVSKIMAQQLQKGSNITKKGIQKLVSALNSNDKLTRILSAKALYTATVNNKKILNDFTLSIRDYLQDKVLDISTYITLAYTKSLKQAQSINSSHIQYLSNAYVFNRLKLGDRDFTQEVNDDILQIFHNQADKHQFVENVFHIFDQILFLDQRNQIIVAKTLKKYTYKKHKIPPNTITALENALGLTEISHDALQALKNAIQNNQKVGERTLQIFIDNLYLSEDENLRKQSFELLNIAEKNQDLSDEFFDKLQLQRAGYVIANNKKDKEEAIDYLKLKTSQSKRLSIDTLNSLYNELRNRNVLNILKNISKNRQLVPEYIINQLIQGFTPQQIQIQRIQIFSNIALNNQNIPQKLLHKLDKCLDNELIFDQIIQIFYQAKETGNQFSENFMLKIHEKFLVAKSEASKLKLLTLIIHSISNKSPQTLIKQALIQGISHQNQKIVEISIQGFRRISKYFKLDQKCIDILINKLKDQENNQEKNKQILQILKFHRLNKLQMTRIQLNELVSKSSFIILQKLSQLSLESKLLQQDFKKLQNILKDKPNLNSHHQVLRILFLCSNKIDISNQLLKFILILAASSSNNEIKQQSYTLIHKIAQTGKIFEDNIIQMLVSKENRKFTSQILKLISKNHKISSHVKLSCDIYKLYSKENIKNFLQEIYSQIRQKNNLSDQDIQKLMQFQSKGDKFDIKLISNIFSCILVNKIKYCSNKKIVYLIQKIIISKDISIDIVNGYKAIISSKNYLNLNLAIDSLIDSLESSLENKRLSFAIIDCLSCATEVTNMSKKGLLLFESYLDSQDEKIRSLSFRGLNAAYNKGQKSEKLQRWCSYVLASLQQKVNVKVQADLSLFDILASLRYINTSRLFKLPQHQWKRQLLISDLIARFKATEGQKFIFYRKWLNFLQKQQLSIIQSQKLLQKLISDQDNFNMCFDQLNEIVDFLTIMDYSFVNKNIFITNNSTFLYPALKKIWIQSLFKKHLKKQIRETYPEKIVQKTCNQINSTNLIRKIFNSLDKIQNFQEFQVLIDFIIFHKVRESDILLQSVSINQLKKELEINTLSKHILPFINNQKKKLLITTLKNLLNTGWSFMKLNQILARIKSSDQKIITSIIQTLYYYKISENKYLTIILVFEELPVESWIKQINKISIQSNFQLTGKVKNSKQIMKELQIINYQNKSIINLINNGLINYLEKIKSKQLKIKILNKFEIVQNLDKYKITLWANNILEDNNSYFKHFDNFVEAIAVIKRANYLHTGFIMTDSQILSCLVALSSNTNQGRLLQVSTGQGKSTIVCALAIVHALNRKKVDIITSSPVLAERDAKQKAGLYKIFKLTCADNNDKSVYIKSSKDCYKKNIVYGQSAQFQFDILRDQYSLLGTRAGRKCELAIVDQVDSMLIDDSSKIARLSSSIAGIDVLQPIYHFIWQRVISMHEKIIEIDGKLCFLYGKIHYVEDIIVLEYADENDNIMKINDLKAYIKLTADISNIGQFIVDDFQVFLKDHLKKYCKELFDKKILTVPHNFKEFVDRQTPKWIQNAIVAFSYKQDVHYVIHQGLIKPVDYNSTGIVQGTTNWSDGLHQFLQIKHSLKMTSQTFITNFLSNIGYFNRYGPQLFGLTGTLGSNKAKEVFSNIYKVDFAIIPTLRQKQFLELPTIIAANYMNWLNDICLSAINEATKERGALIICDAIKNAKVIADKLKISYREGAIKLYIMNDMNQEKEIEKIMPCQIIIATNLAGRGTDIKTDEIQEAGGMHVILTFMPSNQRVQDQAFGRTARQGKRGTGQIILNADSLRQYNHSCGQLFPSKIKQQRNRFEAQILDNFQIKQVKIIKIKDKLFQKFCQLLKNIRKTLNQQKIQKFVQANILSAIEEQWSMFLSKVDDKIQQGQALIQYNQFEQKIKNKQFFSIIKNPYYHIIIANYYIDTKKLEKALQHFDKAIQLDEKFCAAAFAGRGWILLINRENRYKQLAISQFDKALHVLSEQIASLNAITTLRQQNESINSDLSRQLLSKLNILGSYSNSIKCTAETIRQSLRLFDITSKNKNKKYYLKGIQKNSFQNINSLDKNSQIEIQFNDLTVIKDTIQTDQAKKTISSTCKILNKASQKIFFAKKKEKADQKRIVGIKIRSINLQKIQKILNPHIQIKKINKKSAISQLKDKTSFIHKYLPQSLLCKINLIITKANSTIDYKNISVIKGIQIIQQYEGQDYEFSIAFINANKISDKLQEVLRNSTSNIQFIGLNSIIAQDKLKKFQSYQFSLHITANSEDLLEAIDLAKEAEFQFFDFTQKSSITLNFNQAKLRIHKKQKNITIKLAKLTRQSAISIFDKCHHAIFDINFLSINLEEKREQLNEGIVNISFQNLSQCQAYKLVEVLREENMQFILSFTNITTDDLQIIVTCACLDQQDIEINKVNNLENLFLNDLKPALELSEFAARGIEYLLEVSQKGFVPWISIACVVAIAGVQMAAGGALIATGFGANVGMGLLTEGAADLFIAAKVYSSRNFDWSDYIKQKAVSLTISAVSMGMQALKDAGKGVKNLAVGVAEEVLQQAGTKVVTNGKTISYTLVQSGKKLTNLAFTQMGVASCEAGLREGLNKIADKCSEFALDYAKPQISSIIQDKVKNMFLQSNLKYLVHKMYALDNITKSDNLKKKIIRIVAETLNPENNFWCKQWDSIGGPLCKGILSTEKFIGNKLSMCVRLYSTLKGMYEITNIIENIHNNLLMKMSEIEEQQLKLAHIFQKYFCLKAQNAKQRVQILKKEKIIKVQEISIKTTKKFKFQSINIFYQGKFNYREEDKILQFCKNLLEGMKSMKDSDISEILKSLSDAITDQIIRIIKGQLISPWSSFGMGMITNNISNIIQDKLIGNGIPANSQQNEKDTKHLKTKQEYKTYGNQIIREAKQYTIARSQCQNIYYAQQISKNSHFVSEAVRDHSKGVKNNKPADLAVMFTIAARNNINIKIVDDPNYQQTQQDKAKDTKIILFIKGKKDENGNDGIGHYCLLNQQDNLGNNTNNNCGYMVFSQITGKSVNDLRNETAHNIINNSENFSKAIQAQNWVRSHYPQQANSLLWYGGAKANMKKSEYIKQLQQVLANSNLTQKEKQLKAKQLRKKIDESRIFAVQEFNIFQLLNNNNNLNGLVIYGASAVSLHAQGTIYQNQFRAINDIDTVAPTRQIFQIWKSADPSKYTITNISRGNDGHQVIHGFLKVKVDDSGEKYIPMSIYYDPKKFIASLESQNIGGAQVLTLESLKNMQKISHNREAKEQLIKGKGKANAKLLEYKKQYFIRNDHFSNHNKGNNKQKNDIERIQMVEKLLNLKNQKKDSNDLEYFDEN